MTTTIRFRVEAPRAGRVRNIAQDLDVHIENPDDVMPPLHRAMCAWLALAAPGLTGHDLTLWQEHVDPCSGYFQITEGINGGGTWTQVQDPEPANHEEQA